MKSYMKSECKLISGRTPLDFDASWITVMKAWRVRINWPGRHTIETCHSLVAIISAHTCVTVTSNVLTFTVNQTCMIWLHQSMRKTSCKANVSMSHGSLGGLPSQSQRTPQSLWKKRRACSYLGTLALLKRNDQCGQSIQNNLIKPVVYARLAIEKNACLACLSLQGVDISWHIVPVWAEDQRLHRALTCPKPDPTASLLCQVTFWSCSSSSLALVAQFNHLTHRRAWPYTLCWLCFWKSHGSRDHPTKNTTGNRKQIKTCCEKYGQVMPSGSNAHCLQYTRQLLWMDMHSWADAQHRRQPEQIASCKLFESLHCDLRYVENKYWTVESPICLEVVSDEPTFHACKTARLLNSRLSGHCDHCLVNDQYSNLEPSLCTFSMHIKQGSLVMLSITREEIWTSIQGFAQLNGNQIQW